MDKEFINKLTQSFDEENYRGIYISLLKFFSDFDKFNLDGDELNDFITLLNRRKNGLMLTQKEKFLEQTLSDIFKKTEIYEETKIRNEEKKVFFKNQIHGLLLREFKKIQSLLKNKDYEDQITEILLFLFKFIQLNPVKQFLEIYKLYENKVIKKHNFQALTNLIFDFSPKEIISSIFSLLKKGAANDDDGFPSIDLLEILHLHGEIYPELFEQDVDYLISRLNKSSSNRERLLMAQILQKLVENRPQLFISRFFSLLKTFKNILIKGPDPVVSIMESSLNTLFLSENFSILEYFSKNLREDYNQILSLMGKGTEKLNSIVCDFIIDYTNYSKNFHHDGKITEKLLLSYIKVLEFFLNGGFSNEYLLFSILNQFKIRKFEIERISENLRDIDKKRTQSELANYYHEVIEELKNYIKIIFNNDDG